MEVMPSDVEKSGFFKDKRANSKERQKIIPSRWASKENFVESRAKIAERKVMRIKQKEEQVIKQKDSKNKLASKKDKDSIRMSSRQDSFIQNAVFPSQKPIQQEEDNFQSSKSLHKQIRSSQQLKGIYFNRTNGFHITKPKLKKSVPVNQSLPSISTPHNSQASSASIFSAKEVSIVQFGIFSARKDTETFLSKFRALVEQEFVHGFDINNIFDLNRMQYHLLHEIRRSTR